MAKRRKKRALQQVDYVDPHINVMPFVDIFSTLNVFLLFSAVFLTIGIIEVQIPFLSNAPPPEREETRQLEINVLVERLEVEIQTSFSEPPLDEQTERFSLDRQGIAEFHAYLVNLRTQHSETELVTLFSDDDVTFEQITLVLDAIKFRRDGDPMFTERDPVTGEDRTSPFVYPKVVVGSILL